MKRRAVFSIVVLGVAFPVLAADEKKDQTDSATQPAQKTEQKKESPILRLAELRLDEFVVPARMINLPIPGKTRTLQDILKRLEEWSEDDKIGAILLDVGNISLPLPDVAELHAGVKRLREADKKVLAFLNAGAPTPIF